MGAQPPDGETPPADGHLPEAALQGFGSRPFEVYVHVPFCASRCGYCDFNTYTASELGASVRRETFGEVLEREIVFARAITGPSTVDTVFIGGGTPTLLGAGALVGILRRIDDAYGLAAGYEATTEANPDSVDQAMLDDLRAGGFTRISFGVQSAAPGVLQVLERTHGRDSARRALEMAHAAGFEHVSADLIIGTPGETDDDLRRSVDLVLSGGVDHVSAYSLIVESGTRLAHRVARGEIAQPDDDTAAHRYELVDALLREAGLRWYEISNWARPGGECRHNLGYWQDADWWGVGPGAHSHIGGVRWWNHRHPAAYAEHVSQGRSPAQGREVLDAGQRRMEQVMLGVRLGTGADAALLDDAGMRHAEEFAARGLLDADALADGRLVVTDRGRLVADAISRDLLP